MEVLVVGGGVIGLTTAIRLRQMGSDVSLLAESYPPETTSNTAAAVWFPFQAGMDDRVPGWAIESLNTYYELADDPTSGIRISPGIELFREPIPDPWWHSCVRVFRPAEPDELPPGYDYGLVLEAPVIETPIYMQYLIKKCESLGIKRSVQKLTSLNAALEINRLVVNCTGLGSRELCNDTSVYPNRGQVVSVSPPETNRFCFDQTTSPASYIIPRSHDCILGGSTERDQWSLDPSPALQENIISRCLELEDSLSKSTVNSSWIGLRPGRPKVRLELESFADNRYVVHNYGHGGSGFTLAWGCASNAANMLMSSQ